MCKKWDIKYLMKTAFEHVHSVEKYLLNSVGCSWLSFYLRVK